ncbi:MAG: hypothetical protein DID91_2727703916 [Candidatus Nitrotoga sp. MKT]|nr:MAG: hypothetical protein DID91_2727703916 [Candidatus Nitrotoga sp. MKT]
MSPIKFSMALVGLVACFFNSLPVATAASFDKYLIAPLGTISVPGAFTPFLVKASDSSNTEYLNLHYENHLDLPRVELSSDARISGKIVGQFFTLSARSSVNKVIRWEPFVVPNDTTRDPRVDVYLTRAKSVNGAGEVTLMTDEEQGMDRDGNVILETATVPYCDMSLCFPTQKVFTALRGQPQRMTTLNGNQIEVVPVKIRLDSTPWATYYFGYGVGLIAAEAFSTQLYAPSFSPVSLPPPKADGTVVEYVNTLDFPNAPGGHYFYASGSAEQATVDAGGAGKFVRTGRTFASGGFVPVCRFYGSMSPGPNSHFFTASASECEGLKAMQVTPTPASTQQWNFEGNGFYSVTPIADTQGQMQCMAGTQPVYRAYNNAYPKSGGKNPWDSNHRYSTLSADIDEMISKGWTSEGIVLCAPI